MYVGKASNANPTSSYPPCHASMAWGPTICICEMSVWCWEALWLAATWMDTCDLHWHLFQKCDTKADNVEALARKKSCKSAVGSCKKAEVGRPQSYRWPQPSGRPSRWLSLTPARTVESRVKHLQLPRMERPPLPQLLLLVSTFLN